MISSVRLEARLSYHFQLCYSCSAMCLLSPSLCLCHKQLIHGNKPHKQTVHSQIWEMCLKSGSLFLYIRPWNTKGNISGKACKWQTNNVWSRGRRKGKNSKCRGWETSFDKKYLMRSNECYFPGKHDISVFLVSVITPIEEHCIWIDEWTDWGWGRGKI